MSHLNLPESFLESHFTLPSSLRRLASSDDLGVFPVSDLQPQPVTKAVFVRESTNCNQHSVQDALNLAALAVSPAMPMHTDDSAQFTPESMEQCLLSLFASPAPDFAAQMSPVKSSTSRSAASNRYTRTDHEEAALGATHPDSCDMSHRALSPVIESSASKVAKKKSKKVNRGRGEGRTGRPSSCNAAVIRAIEAYIREHEQHTQQEITNYLAENCSIIVSRPTVCRWIQRIRAEKYRKSSLSLSETVQGKVDNEVSAAMANGTTSALEDHSQVSVKSARARRPTTATTRTTVQAAAGDDDSDPDWDEVEVPEPKTPPMTRASTRAAVTSQHLTDSPASLLPSIPFSPMAAWSPSVFGWDLHAADKLFGQPSTPMPYHLMPLTPATILAQNPSNDDDHSSSESTHESYSPSASGAEDLDASSVDALSLHSTHNISHNKVIVVTFLQQQDRILLQKAVDGVGKGLWNGFTTVVTDSQDVFEVARNSVKECTGCSPSHVKQHGLIFAKIPGEAEILEMHVFAAFTNTAEVPYNELSTPTWFCFGDIPFKSMWADSALWLPKLLVGEAFTCAFSLSADMQLTDPHLVDGMQPELQLQLL